MAQKGNHSWREQINRIIESLSISNEIRFLLENVSKLLSGVSEGRGHAVDM